jgi:isopentenyldiphosphate isomerase
LKSWIHSQEKNQCDKASTLRLHLRFACFLLQPHALAVS